MTEPFADNRGPGQTLIGKRALVTGAGSGLGREIAIALARAGAAVACLDVNQDGAEDTARGLGGNTLTLVASVADDAAIAAAFARIDGDWGGLDILVNNAGINMNRPTLDLTLEEWCRTRSINLDGPFYCAREAALRMSVQGSGAIVSISSIYGLVAAPNRAAYCATKAGIIMLTKSLAVEWAAMGIRVNAVAPGYAETPALRTLAGEGRIDMAALAARTPQGRLAEPEEIADAVLYLCEPRSAHVTGQVLAVDGGWTAYGYI